ncbi:MAG: hypothetical protein PPP56_10520 [Longimonas sp.]|uniref:hypothetical protein n=1 Tax=Longimonas sp. TaxID=2039626 RepID=UPI0033488454
MTVKQRLRRFWRRFNESPYATPIKRWGQRLLVVGIVGVIAYQLFEIGWAEVLRSLPTEPLFYILFFISFFTLSIAEIFIYRQVWPLSRWKLFKAFLTKRVYNDEVMGYSGEFYLAAWAQKNLGIDVKEIAKHVRDNNILSAVASNTVAVVLIGLLIFTDVIGVEDVFGNVDVIHVLGGVFIIAVVSVLFVQYREYIFSLPLRTSLIVFSIYLTRFVIHHGLLVAQWAVVLPDVPLSTWLIFATVIIIVKRIPFIPSRELVFMWAGIELSRTLNMATASVAGMLLVTSVLKKLTNLVFFLILSYTQRQPMADSTSADRADDRASSASEAPSA